MPIPFLLWLLGKHKRASQPVEVIDGTAEAARLPETSVDAGAFAPKPLVDQRGQETQRGASAEDPRHRPTQATGHDEGDQADDELDCPQGAQLRELDVERAPASVNGGAEQRVQRKVERKVGDDADDGSGDAGKGG
jgi:hypothetical protein